MVNRFFGFLLLVVVAGASVLARAHGGPTRLTEAQAVERALRNPALADLRAGWAGQARADGLQRTTWPNPSVQYTREQILGSEALGEDYVTLSQTLDISGRKGLARHAARHRERAAEHRADAVAADLAAEVRRRFYRLLLAQQREDALDGWKRRIDERLVDVAKRERSGDAAAYDRLRLQREVMDVEARLELERAERARAWALLQALIEPAGERIDTIPLLDGDILPALPRRDVRQISDATSNVPTVRAQQAEAEALVLDKRASSRWWVANPTIGGGYKGVELPGGGRAHGFVLTFGVALPVLDRQRAQRERAAAEARSLRAEASLQAMEARGQATGLWHEVTQLTGAAQTMMRDGATQAEALLTAAESGYRGGEIGVVELTDAYRSVTQAQLLALDLAMKARLAQIELTRLTGGAT